MKILIALLLSLAASLAETLRWELEGNPEWLGGYRIYWDIVPGLKPSEQEVFVDAGKMASYNIDSLIDGAPPDTDCYFIVTAYNTENVEGPPSNEVSYRKPPAPTPTPSPAPTPTPTPVPTPIPIPTVPPHTHTWDEITGKPAVFPNEPHTHVVPATESSQ